THTGGWVGDFFNATGWGDDALALNVRKLVGAKQLTKLGSVWHYSNSGFYLAGRVLEKVFKKPYEDAISELLFVPLGMNESFLFPTDVMLRRFAVGHITEGKRNTVAATFRGSRGGAPAGAIVSSAADQLKWGAFHMGDGRAPNGKRLLKKSTLEYMRKPQFHVGSMTEDVGISWLLNTVGGLKTARHGGTTIGFLSAFVMVPEKNFAVTVLTNSTSGRMLHASVVGWAFEKYLGVGPAEESPIKVDSNGLAEYGGHYQSQSNKEVVVDAVVGRAVTLRFPTSIDPPRSTPMPIRFHAPDKFVVISGPYKGTHSDFLRSGSGKIRWLRFGGRLYRRISKTAGKAATRKR
ncbi:MAG: serine hydrolase domain-containing protein, partial [Acidimicrobiia bacterium]